MGLLADEIVRIRTRSGKSRHRAARDAGIDPGYFYRIEGSKWETPGREVVISVAGSIGATDEERDRLLAYAGHLPVGSWEGYRPEERWRWGDDPDLAAVAGRLDSEQGSGAARFRFALRQFLQDYERALERRKATLNGANRASGQVASYRGPGV